MKNATQASKHLSHSAWVAVWHFIFPVGLLVIFGFCLLFGWMLFLAESLSSTSVRRGEATVPWPPLQTRDGTGRLWSGFWAGRWGWTSGPLTIFLAVGLHRAATSRPLMLKNPLKFFCVERTTRWQWKWLKPLGIALPLLYLKAYFLFPYVTWALRQARPAGRDENWTGLGLDWIWTLVHSVKFGLDPG